MMIRAWLAFDVVASSRDVAESSLRKHVSKMLSLPAVREVETKYHEPEETEFHGKKAFSAAAETTVEISSFKDLVNIIMVYGPSAIEIMGPEKVELPLSDMQDICNVVSGMMHRFAAAGLGGLVINAEK